MKRYYLLSVLFVATVGSSAQSLIGSAGEVQEGDGVQLSFSIGEPVVETLGTTTVLTQGFQQVDLINTDIPESALADIALYPNPCRDQLFLTLDSPGNYELLICDMSGKRVLAQQEAFSSISSLDVSSLKKGLYIMQIREEGAEHFQALKFQKTY